MRRLRLGILGTGTAARKLYLKPLLALRARIQVLACANRSRAKAEDYARQLGIPRVLDNGEDLLAQPDLDAVLISLPIEAQPAWVLKALKAGKHVLSEKPVAPDLAAGRALLKAAAPYQRRGLKWLVGENYAFMPHVQQLQRWLEAGVLGDLRLVEAQQANILDSGNPYFNTAWRTQPRFVGGFVLDAGVHLAHVLRRNFGLPTRIQSQTAQFNPALPPMDSLVATLRFPNQLLGTWVSCFAAQGRQPWLLVRGSKADAELHGDRALLKPHGRAARTFLVRQDSFKLQFKHFADAVLDGQALALSPREALGDLALMQGLVEGRVLKP